MSTYTSSHRNHKRQIVVPSRSSRRFVNHWSSAAGLSEHIYRSAAAKEDRRSHTHPQTNFASAVAAEALGQAKDAVQNPEQAGTQLLSAVRAFALQGWQTFSLESQQSQVEPLSSRQNNVGASVQDSSNYATFKTAQSKRDTAGVQMRLESLHRQFCKM